MKTGTPAEGNTNGIDTSTRADIASGAIGSASGGLGSSIIGAVGNIAATVGAIISSKETTKQSALNKEIATLQIESGQTALDVEKQKTLQASINAKKTELAAVQRSENIKTFTNAALILGGLVMVSLVAYWTLRPAKTPQPNNSTTQ